MKVISILAFALLENFASLGAFEDQILYFRGVFCNLSEKYIFPNYTSRSKSYNRTFSSTTILATAREPIYDIFLQISYDYKYGNIYREVLKTPSFDFCEVVRAGSRNPLVAQMVPIPKYRNNMDDLLHECPYEVRIISSEYLIGSTFSQYFRLRDYSPQIKYMQIIWPSGDYRIRYGLKTKGEFLGLCRVFMTMTTPDKNNFW